MSTTIFGILLGLIILVVTNRREPESGATELKPTFLSWCTLAFGIIAAAALALAIWQTPAANNTRLGPWPISLTFTIAAVMVGIGALIRRDRRWPTLAGLGVGLVPAIVWIAFAAGNILGLGE